MVSDGKLAYSSTLRLTIRSIEGPLEMREVIRHHAKLGVDQIKLSMSGEEVNFTSPSDYIILIAIRFWRLALLKNASSMKSKQLHALMRHTVSDYGFVLTPELEIRLLSA